RQESHCGQHSRDRQCAVDGDARQRGGIHAEEGHELGRLRYGNGRVLDAAGAMLGSPYIEAQKVHAGTRENEGSSQGEVATTATNSALAAPTDCTMETMPSIRPRLRFLSKARLFMASLTMIALEAH